MSNWEDVRDEWSDAISKAHPARDGSTMQDHDRYAVVMRIVGNRHSKGTLVALVNWLLKERDDATNALGRMKTRLAESQGLAREAREHLVTLKAQFDELQAAADRLIETEKVAQALAVNSGRIHV
jgi:hypothetical protein